MDGFEVLDFLHKRNSSTRIIILSGAVDYRTMISRMAEGLELAIVATVAKPFRVAELRELLEKIKLSLPTSNRNLSTKVTQRIKMTPHRLLVIEDVQSIADLLCHAATDVGFDVRSANGATATITYDNFHPNIIVLDLLISGMEEFAFLRFLKARSSLARIVILSGCSEIYRKTAEDMGTSSGLLMEANISKPFRISEVRAIFEKIKKTLPMPKENIPINDVA